MGTSPKSSGNIIDRIFMQALSNKKLSTGLNDESEQGEKFWLFKLATFDTSGDDFIERGYRYQAKYLDLELPEDFGEVPMFDIEQFEALVDPLPTNEIKDIAESENN
jgi:hypothetical protein